MPIPRSNRLLYAGTLPPHTGGSAISCGELLARVAGAGYSISALAPITAETLQGGDRFAATHPELRIVRYRLPRFENELSADGMMGLEEKQVHDLFNLMVESVRPDLVIVGRESFARYVPQLAAARGIPIMQWIRGGPYSGYDHWTHTGHGQHLVGEFRKAARILTAADHLTEDLRRLGFCNVSTIPNAIDLKRFSPQPASNALRRELAISDDDKPILVPGNLILRKRPFDIIESARRALEHDPKLVYVMAGAGVRQDEVKAACREKNIGERFRFPGWVDYARMPDLFNLADFVIVASESEGLARVYLEAMASGKLLLASDIDAVRELITDHVNGLLFPVGDIAELTAKTLLAAGDPQLRATLGRRARETVQQRSVNHAANHYVNEIATLISGNSH